MQAIGVWDGVCPEPVCFQVVGVVGIRGGISLMVVLYAYGGIRKWLYLRVESLGQVNGATLHELAP